MHGAAALQALPIQARSPACVLGTQCMGFVCRRGPCPERTLEPYGVAAATAAAVANIRAGAGNRFSHFATGAVPQATSGAVAKCLSPTWRYVYEVQCISDATRSLDSHTSTSRACSKPYFSYYPQSRYTGGGVTPPFCLHVFMATHSTPRACARLGLAHTQETSNAVEQSPHTCMQSSAV